MIDCCLTAFVRTYYACYRLEIGLHIALVCIVNINRAEKKSWYVIARNFFLLLLTLSAWKRTFAGPC